MTKPLDGVRIVEVAAWTFVPGAGAMLSDLGADVIKVEPLTGDPQRGLQNMLNLGDRSGPNPFVQIPNRGKRSIGLDLANEEGRALLLRLVEKADVFLTSYLPATRQKLGIDVDDLRAVNPKLVYVRGSGWGSKGPLANQGGFDLASGWASGGTAFKLTPPGGEPPMQPAAFYDLQGSTAIAGAISAALFSRERTGEPSVVDVSLLNVSMWTLSPDIVAGPYVGAIPPQQRTAPGNPVVNWYKTKDERWLYLVLLQADRFWSELCEYIGAEGLAKDPRFVDATARSEHRTECVQALDAVFATKTLDEWRDQLRTFSGVWAPALSPAEVHDHEQVEANGYLPTVHTDEGDLRLVGPPMQFDGEAAGPQGPAPDAGQHTEEILLELGLDWDEIIAHKERGSVL
jgi:crotonobetainyl-CoA:carnitine CoA-transferase CaiB-like acyl-CoA transferase